MVHKAIAYKSQPFADVPASGCSPRPIVGGTGYSVVCPACSGHFTVERVEGVFRGGSFRKQPSALPPKIPVACDCGLDHDDRPPDAFTGCGAAWCLSGD